MSLQHAKSNEVIQLPVGAALGSAKTTTLAKTPALELIRMVLPAGKQIASHKAPGEITVQCLEGRVAWTADGKTQELNPGQLLYHLAGEPHSVKAIEASSLLVTMLMHKKQ